MAGSKKEGKTEANLQKDHFGGCRKMWQNIFPCFPPIKRWAGNRERWRYITNGTKWYTNTYWLGTRGRKEQQTEVYCKFIICCGYIINREVAEKGRCGYPELQGKAVGYTEARLIRHSDHVGTSWTRRRSQADSCFFGSDQMARFEQVTLKHAFPTRFVSLVRQFWQGSAELATASVRIQNLHRYPYRGINPFKTKRRPLYLKPQSVPRCKHFSSGL